jgi:hypothetical protein
VLQDRLAKNASELITNEFVTLKELIASLISLEGVQGEGDNEQDNEERLQAFLRGSQPEEVSA